MTVAEISAARSPEWRATLDLKLAHRAGRTVVAERRHFGPLMIQRPFYPEPDGTAHVYVLHPPGGVVGGDQLAIGVELEAEATAVFTTPAATKLYRTRGPMAVLRQTLTVRAGASLEWFPQETIAFGGSMAESSTRVDLDPGARYLGWEITCLGRPASGDGFEAGWYRQRLEIWRGNELLLVDRTLADARGDARKAAWGWGGRSVYATLSATGGSDELVRAIRAAVEPERSGDLFAVTALPGITVCRWLGSSTAEARAALTRAWQVLRPELLGKPACAPRIWAT